MQSHSSGCIKGNRLGSNPVRHSWIIPFTTAKLTSGTDVKLCTLPGSTFNPLAYSCRIIVGTANNSGTSAVARIGTASGGTTLINDVDLKAAAGTNYTTTNVFTYGRVDVDIWVRVTSVGTAATTGEFAILIEPFELNVADPNTLEA